MEDAWEFFANILKEQMDCCIPRTVPKKQKRRKIWMTKEGTAKYRQKHRAWKTYKSSGNRLDYIRATNEKNEFTLLVRIVCRDFEHNLATNLKHNPKAFWRYCKSKLKNRSRLGDLKTESGDRISDDSAKANLLNEYFASVFTLEDIENIPDIAQKYYGLETASTTFTIEQIEKKLRKLKTTKSAGPDGFHPRLEC